MAKIYLDCGKVVETDLTSDEVLDIQAGYYEGISKDESEFVRPQEIFYIRDKNNSPVAIATKHISCIENDVEKNNGRSKI